MTDPIAIRRAALIDEIVKVDDAWNVPEKLGEGAVAALMARRRAIVTEARALSDHPPPQTEDGWRSDMEAAPLRERVLLKFEPPFLDLTDNGISVGMRTEKGWWLTCIFAASDAHHKTPVAWMPISPETTHDK